MLEIEGRNCPGTELFSEGGDFHRSWSKNSSLGRGDDFVLNTAPCDAPTEERGGEIGQVQKWNEQCNHNINPGLRHDFSLAERDSFGYADHTQSATKRSQKQGKGKERDDLKGGPGVYGEIEREQKPKQEGETKKKMRGESRGPHFGTIDARDLNLAVGEFQETREIGLNIGWREALGNKNDPAAASLDGVGEGVVIAEGILPDLEHVKLFEKGTANGGATTPTEIFRMAAEHSDDGRVPGSEKSVWKGIVGGNEPAHGGGGADARIGERGNNVMQPGFARAAVGVHKDQDFKIGRELFDGDTEIIDLFAGARGLASNDDMGLHSRGSSDAFHEAVCWIIF